jgi:hypothetical protein
MTTTHKAIGDFYSVSPIATPSSRGPARLAIFTACYDFWNDNGVAST